MFSGFFQRNKKKLAWLGLITAGVGLGGGVAYYWYKKRKDESKEKAKREQQMKYLFSENNNSAKVALFSVMPAVSIIMISDDE